MRRAVRWLALPLFATLGCQPEASHQAGRGTADATRPERTSPLAPDAVRPLQASAPPALTGTLAFHSDRAGRHKIFAIDLRSGDVAARTSGALHHDEDAAWSSDGTRLAFSTNRFDARTYDIAVMDADGSRIRRLTDHPAFDRHPAWMPDGRSVLFSSERDGTQAIFRVWLDTARVARVSPMPERALRPAVSPDGRYVAYTVGTTDGFQIVVQDLATGFVRQRTHVADGASRPAWSPDGTRLVYTRLPPGASFLEILTMAGGETTQLAVEGVRFTDEAAWSPDGEWVVASGTSQTGPREDWDLLLLETRRAGGAFRLTSGHASDRVPAWHRR